MNITGELPDRISRFSVEDGRTVERSEAPRVPASAEVTIAVAGSAIGAAPGAEISGNVVATGATATEWLGRRVVVPRVLPCGECDRCRRGRAAACPSRAPRGDVATHETVPARYLLTAEPPLDPGDALWRWAALADAASAPYGALVRAQLAPGDLLIIVGGGVRGCFAAAIARAKGAHVAVLDADPARRERARAAGAQFLVDGERVDAAGARATLEGEARAAGIERIEWKVIETTGTAAGRRRAVALLSDGSTAVLLSDGDGGEVTAALDAVAEREATVIGAAACHPDLFPELAALVVRGDLRLEAHVTALPFSALAEALASVRSGRTTTLPVLVPRVR